MAASTGKCSPRCRALDAGLKCEIPQLATMACSICRGKEHSRRTRGAGLSGWGDLGGFLTGCAICAGACLAFVVLTLIVVVVAEPAKPREAARTSGSTLLVAAEVGTRDAIAHTTTTPPRRAAPVVRPRATAVPSTSASTDAPPSPPPQAATTATPTQPEAPAPTRPTRRPWTPVRRIDEMPGLAAMVALLVD